MAEANANDFPPYPEVERLPAGLSEPERYAFAMRTISEHGDNLGDYLFAAVRNAPDIREMQRWVEMGELVEEIYGAPITLSYRACDRMAAEDAGADAVPPTIQ